MLANLQTGRSGRDRLELTANARRGFGFQIETLMLRQSAGEKDVDATSGLAAACCIRSLRRTKGVEMVCSHTEQPNRPGLNGGSTRKLRMLHRLRIRSEHGDLSCRKSQTFEHNLTRLKDLRPSLAVAVNRNFPVAYNTSKNTDHCR